MFEVHRHFEGEEEREDHQRLKSLHLMITGIKNERMEVIHEDVVGEDGVTEDEEEAVRIYEVIGE